MTRFGGWAHATALVLAALGGGCAAPMPDGQIDEPVVFPEYDLRLYARSQEGSEGPEVGVSVTLIGATEDTPCSPWLDAAEAFVNERPMTRLSFVPDVDDIAQCNWEGAVPRCTARAFLILAAIAAPQCAVHHFGGSVPGVLNGVELDVVLRSGEDALAFHVDRVEAIVVATAATATAGDSFQVFGLPSGTGAIEARARPVDEVDGSPYAPWSVAEDDRGIFLQTPVTAAGAYDVRFFYPDLAPLDPCPFRACAGHVDMASVPHRLTLTPSMP